MDLGTPEPESESDGEMSKIAPRGPRTPPDYMYSEGEERMPHTPEGSPPPRTPPRRHKGPRTPSPSRDRLSSSRHKGRRSKSKRKRRSRSRSLKVKGPRTPSPPPSGRSPTWSHVTLKRSRSPSPCSKNEGHTPSDMIASPPQDPLPTSNSPKLQDENENSSIIEEKSSIVAVEYTESQVEKSGSNNNSPIPKPDSLKSHSPIPIPVSQQSPPAGTHSPHSSSPEHSPLDLSLTSDPGGTEPPESAPPPRKKRRGEGKVKSKASKAKEDYRHKVSMCVCMCVCMHRLALFGIASSLVQYLWLFGSHNLFLVMVVVLPLYGRSCYPKACSSFPSIAD